MNKQEAIEKIEKEKSNLNAWEDLTRNRALDDALAIVRKLDEPEKPVVPQFVADWYEENKDDFEFKIYCLCVEFHDRPVKLDNRIRHWFSKTSNKSIQTLVAMHFFGYEVGEEKLYTVEIPNPNRSERCITFLARKSDGKVELYNWTGYTSIDFEDRWKQQEYAQLTEDEIKEDFAWAWQFAEEVEE